MPAAYGDLFAVVAHDLLNPLTAILLSTGRLQAAVANSTCAPGTLLLGLAKTIVEANGGHIWAESEPAGGTTFQFTVPVSR
jgi:signal transduction histidine kinase